MIPDFALGNKHYVIIRYIKKYKNSIVTYLFAKYFIEREIPIFLFKKRKKEKKPCEIFFNVPNSNVFKLL